jgi:hypothetical protein
LNYRNYIQGNTGQNRVWSSLWQISSQEDYKKSYFGFFSFILFSMHFRKLNDFLEVLNWKRKLKNVETVAGRFRPNASWHSLAQQP